MVYSKAIDFLVNINSRSTSEFTDIQCAITTKTFSFTASFQFPDRPLIG